MWSLNAFCDKAMTRDPQFHQHWLLLCCVHEPTVKHLQCKTLSFRLPCQVLCKVFRKLKLWCENWAKATVKLSKRKTKLDLCVPSCNWRSAFICLLDKLSHGVLYCVRHLPSQSFSTLFVLVLITVEKTCLISWFHHPRGPRAPHGAALPVSVASSSLCCCCVEFKGEKKKNCDARCLPSEVLCCHLVVLNTHT